MQQRHLRSAARLLALAVPAVLALTVSGCTGGASIQEVSSGTIAGSSSTTTSSAAASTTTTTKAPRRTTSTTEPDDTTSTTDRPRRSTTTSTAAVPDEPTLDLGGFGPIKIGMTADQVEAQGVTLTLGPGCQGVYAVKGHGYDLSAAFDDGGHLAVVGISSESTPSIATRAGIRYGSTETALKAAYGSDLVVEPVAEVQPGTRVYVLTSAGEPGRLWFWVAEGAVFRIDATLGTSPWIPC